MSIASCCPRCGAPSSPLLSNSSSGLCVCCSTAAADPSLPWWVTAPQPALPSTAPAPDSPSPRTGLAASLLTSIRRFPGRYAGAAVLLAAALVFSLWPRATPADPSPEKAAVPGSIAEAGDSAHEPSPIEAQAPQPRILQPAPRPPEKSATPDHPTPGRQRAERRIDSHPTTALASTPLPLPSPLDAPQLEAPARPAAAKPRTAHSLHGLDQASEEELLGLAARAPEVGIGTTAPAILNSYLSHVPANEVVLANPNLTDATPLLEVRPDLLALPLRFGQRCKLNGKLTTNLDRLSRRLRVYLDTFNPAGPDGRRRGTPGKLHETLREEKLGKTLVWLRPEAIPGLLQILMGEEAPFRLVLVDLLGRIAGPASTTALAQRAVFDFNPDVRKAAVAALKKRPASDYRPVLLKALRYPWAVPAQHAAETLLDLGDNGAVPNLVSLLRLPNPSGPLTIGKDRHIIQDVVRLSHLHNCLLCHPPAATANEPVLGVDPFVPLPVVLQTPSMTQGVQQTQSLPGVNGGGYSSAAGASQGAAQLPLLIRADITFLRQDFSVLQPVTGPSRPGMTVVQRFDYVVRTRTLSRSLSTRLEAMLAERTSYPQRDAILFALRGLTGKDPGASTEDWLQLFPNAETDVKAAQLSRALLRCNGVERVRLLTKYRDSKGLVYTQALACAISSLSGSAKEQARGALVKRLERMTAKTLRDKLEDEDAEVRRAAMLACASKKEKQVVPDLIALVDNAEPLTARLAEEGLNAITGEHLKHPAAWRSWWEKEGKKATLP